MKNLESKILEKVYVMETKKTSLSFFLKTIIFSLSAFITILFVQVLMEVFAETRTFSIWELFTEDVEVVSRHIGDIVFDIFQETPTLLIVVILFSVSITIFIFLTFINNFGKIKHKTEALFRYWKTRVQ